jgi:uncharacterized protein YndB with AHSA1/START domain
MTAAPDAEAEAGRGTVDLAGDRAHLAFRRQFAHPPSEVWAAITDPRELAQWYMTDATIEPREGGAIAFTSGPSRFHITGRILRWEPPRLFEHEWKVAARPELPTGEDAVVRWELTPVAGGTLLSFSFRGLRRRTGIGFAPGVHAFLDRLAAQLDRRPLPNWAARGTALRPMYPGWDA